MARFLPGPPQTACRKSADETSCRSAADGCAVAGAVLEPRAIDRRSVRRAGVDQFRHRPPRRRDARLVRRSARLRRSFPRCRPATVHAARTRRCSSRQDDGTLSTQRPVQPAPDVMASGLKQVRMNNPVRGAIDAALGSLRLFSSDRTIAARRSRSGVPVARPCRAAGAGPCPREGNRSGCQTAHGAGARRRAAVVADASEPDRLAAVTVLRARGDIDSRSLLDAVDGPTARGRSGRRRRDHGDRSSAAALERRTEHLLRAVPRLGAAAGRGRAGDHLRRHGRDQHGARRDGDDRRLRDLRGAAGDPRQRALAVRRQSADRGSARLHRGGSDRHRHRAHADPLAVRPPAGNTAGDLGAVAGAAAGGALDLRRQQPRRRARRTG